jgi:segregation and condensation protein B
MPDVFAADPGGNVTSLSSNERRLHLRMLEALLFAAREPQTEADLAGRMPQGVDLRTLLKELQAAYAGRGVNLWCFGGRWAFRTAADLAFLLRPDAVETRRLSRAALETLAVIAYHQPVTRAEIEDVRGVGVSKGSLDVLLESGWVRLRGRRRVPGRPVTYGTTPVFLDHFGLETIDDLPGLTELKGAGLLDAAVPLGPQAREPDASRAADEDPLSSGP